MNSVEYDRALYYTYMSKWDDLVDLMAYTSDDIFSKKIERFVRAYQNGRRIQDIDYSLKNLFHYIDHAMTVSDHK